MLTKRSYACVCVLLLGIILLVGGCIREKEVPTFAILHPPPTDELTCFGLCGAKSTYDIHWFFNHIIVVARDADGNAIPTLSLAKEDWEVTFSSAISDGTITRNITYHGDGAYWLLVEWISDSSKNDSEAVRYVPCNVIITDEDTSFSTQALPVQLEPQDSDFIHILTGGEFLLD